MHGPEVLFADPLVEFGEGLLEGRGVAQVVARGEGVAGVQADGDAGFIVDKRDDVVEVLEAGADDVAGWAGGHVFEERQHGAGCSVGFVQLGC